MTPALVERLRAATEGDRGLDGLIARDVEGWLPYFDLEGDALLDWPHMGGHWHLPDDPCDGRHSVSHERNPDPPEYTASVDAALALIERLYGTDSPSMLYSYDMNWHASAHAHMAYTATLHIAIGDPPDMRTYHGQAHTQPLALLQALLTALSEPNHE